MLAKAGKKQWFLTIKTLLCTNCTCMMTYAFRSDFSSVAAVRLRHNRAIYTRKNKTRLQKDANFPYKRHISSKIRRGLAKTRLIR